MINLNVVAKEKKIIEACDLFVDNMNGFLTDLLANHKDVKFDPLFTSKTLTMPILVDVIKSIEVTINVKQYKGKPKVYGYYSGKYPDDINVNINSLKNRTVESVAGTALHEGLHFIDRKCIDYNFGHGDNSSVGKQNTVPYLVGNLFKNYLTRLDKNKNKMADLGFEDLGLCEVSSKMDYARLFV
jgi:hypothetical protein